MSLGKKEIKLIIVLGLLVYAFLFYMIFVNKYIPEINDVNSKLSEAQAKENALKDDLVNIDQKRSELNTKNIIGERFGNYLIDKGDVTDCIDYMEKLERLMNNRLTDVEIKEPVEVKMDPNAQSSSSNTSTSDEKLIGSDDTSSTSATNTSSSSGQNYYEMEMNFRGDLAYNEIWDLLTYIEGGSKRVQVTKFDMEPYKDNAKTAQNASTAPKATPTPTPNPGQQLSGTAPIGSKYSITMTIKLYAQNL
ncbi:MAG: hypothetical protein Q8942_18485, partial [Bacillota bacterium]|nr:hypothetical protein [Bacillota bacterium]